MNPEELWQTTLNPDKEFYYKFNIQIIQKLNQKRSRFNTNTYG